MSKSILHRVPDSLLAEVDAWALAHGEVNRTVAINLLLSSALEADARAVMQAEIDGLRQMVIKLALGHPDRKPSPLNEALRRAAFTPSDPEFAPLESKEDKQAKTIAAYGNALSK